MKKKTYCINCDSAWTSGFHWTNSLLLTDMISHNVQSIFSQEEFIFTLKGAKVSGATFYIRQCYSLFDLLLKLGVILPTSVSGVISWVAASFRMSFKCLCVTLYCSFVSLMLITNLFTKRGSLQHGQNSHSKSRPFGVTWQEKLIKCVQAKSESHCQSIISSWMLTGRSEALTVNCEQKVVKSVSGSQKIWNCCLNSRSNPGILSLYRVMSVLALGARPCCRRGKWAGSPPESCVFHKVSFNLNACMLS